MANIVKMAIKAVRFRLGRPYVQHANALRNRSEWIEAVIGYRRALDWMPWREDLKIQIGNCLKEYGDYRAAVRSYSGVVGGMHRPEALKQIADASRRAGTDLLAYVITERPDQVAPAGNGPVVMPSPTARDLPNRVQVESEEPRRWLGSLGRDDNQAVRRKGNNYPSIMFDQVGSLSMVRDGAIEPLFAGMIAVRARIFSLAQLDTVELWLGEGDAAVRLEAAPVRFVERGMIPIRLHVANIWIDSARLPAGRHWLSLRAGKHAPSAGLFVNVAEAGGPLPDLAGSDAFVPSPPPGTADPAAFVVAAPAQVRAAARSVLEGPVRSILAIRVDQLGDVSASLPAMARLRGLFPGATLTALVQPGVRAVVEASGIADRVLPIALDYSPLTERRHLPPAEEARVRALLGDETFDLAIDLSPGDETRPLLLLTGATHLVGFNPDRFTFLDYGIGLRSRDKVNQLEKLSHAAAVMTLVEALAVAVAPRRPVVPRAAPVDAVLAEHGLTPRGHVVLHTGARHPINCWPAEHFIALAERVLAETPLNVVMFGGDMIAGLAALRGNPRVRVFDLLDADAFDAILSSARVMVGNDSGPKHLAATRGVATVSLHVGRLNWNEWGQDGAGTILSKRVPCVGCGLNDVQLCGRDAVCIRSIGVDEAMAAVRAQL
ncbi:glycosyltransferase family 9 protein [Sphingomonas profundi]|uniref:glycosyltransferase family 9 protein n=1 Tax=Alterirhizorhabdus profundi TaxID=2681549 RepID=UPI0012E92D01|nr:glycosyltransferase family 9 protein [Sphingomonas profundi]